MRVGLRVKKAAWRLIARVRVTSSWEGENLDPMPTFIAFGTPPDQNGMQSR